MRAISRGQGYAARRRRVVAVAVGLATLAPCPGLAQQPLVVVELFTSQGCSTCPPADAFLTELAHSRPETLPLAFHVTYWNDLGWKDPFALPVATARQQKYARQFGDDEVYTPEMVVNGTTHFVGSHRAEGLSAIAEAASPPAKSIAVGLTRDGNILIVSVGPGAERATILLVGYDPVHQTRVARGENSGRSLLESNIVRSLTQAGSWTGKAAEFRSAIPAGERMAALLQTDDGRILGAAWLGAPRS